MMSPKRKKRGQRPAGAPYHGSRPGPARPGSHRSQAPRPRPGPPRPRAPVVDQEPADRADRADGAAPTAPTAPANGPVQIHEGVLEMHPKGYGFRRAVAAHY